MKVYQIVKEVSLGGGHGGANRVRFVVQTDSTGWDEKPGNPYPLFKTREAANRFIIVKHPLVTKIVIELEIE